MLKNNTLSLLLLLVSSVITLFGCSNEATVINDNFHLIASEKTLPANMHELAFEREETPHYQYLVRMADNQSDFEGFWKLYEFKNQAPELDFNEKNIFFVGVYESGSCQSKIGKVDSKPGITTITIAHPDGACTTDATPRTFVIQIDKDESINTESVNLIEGNTETSVPLK